MCRTPFGPIVNRERSRGTYFSPQEAQMTLVRSPSAHACQDIACGRPTKPKRHVLSLCMQLACTAHIHTYVMLHKHFSPHEAQRTLVRSPSVHACQDILCGRPTKPNRYVLGLCMQLGWTAHIYIQCITNVLYSAQLRELVSNAGGFQPSISASITGLQNAYNF